MQLRVEAAMLTFEVADTKTSDGMSAIGKHPRFAQDCNYLINLTVPFITAACPGYEQKKV
jgi:hypothetical protein